MFFLEMEPNIGAGLAQLLLPFLIMIAVFYFLLFRPQQAQQKRRQEMLGALKTGDKVVTLGGIFGEITALRDDYVTVRIADDVEVNVTRAGIGSVVK